MTETNYRSGEDYEVEFLSYRFQFNRRDFEERVNSCLDRSFMQKVAAEGVYRADTSEFQVLERALQPVALLGCRPGSGLFNLTSEAKLHLAGRFFGEGHRHEPR